MPELTLTLSDAASLRALFEAQLSKKRAFLPDAGGVEPQMACDLVLKQGGRTHRLTAEVVYVKAEDPGRGVGLQLAQLDAAAAEALKAFVDAATDAAPVAPVPTPAEAAPQAANDDDEGPDSQDAGSATRLHERIRTLSSVEQQRLAANGTLSERIAIERMYGPNVWEVLLRNPRITVPEIARIARKGTLPRPLIEAIAANGTWVAAGEVTRAILSNPRATSAVIGRVLQSMSRGDIARATQQTAYPQSVRNAAKKLLNG